MLIDTTTFINSFFAFFNSFTIAFLFILISNDDFFLFSFCFELISNSNVSIIDRAIAGLNCVDIFVECLMIVVENVSLIKKFVYKFDEINERVRILLCSFLIVLNILLSISRQFFCRSHRSKYVAVKLLIKFNFTVCI